MKEIHAISSNLHAVFADDGTILPYAEVIIIVTEPAYSDAGVDREFSHYRFSASPEHLRHMALQFAALANASESAVFNLMKK